MSRPLAWLLATCSKAEVRNGKEAIEYDNPFDVGMTGLIGFSSGYYAMNDCDAQHSTVNYEAGRRHAIRKVQRQNPRIIGVTAS